MIYFTKHAKEKFDILKNHNLIVTKKQVEKTLKSPDTTDCSRLPLIINQIKIDKNHVLRVVYKEERDVIKVITFYPGRIRKYEKQ